LKRILDIPSIVYRDIIGIHDYIALDNPSAANKTKIRIVSAIEALPENPFSGIELRKNSALTPISEALLSSRTL
jgi:plasmid stabilization system protein ParE